MHAGSASDPVDPSIDADADPVRLSISPYAQSLRLIIQFRALAAPVGLLFVWLARGPLALVFDHEAILMIIGIQAFLGLVTWLSSRQSERPVTVPEVLVQVHLDILLLAAILYFSGGTTNPLAPLLLLPLVAVASLPRPCIWATAVSTVVAYVLLRNHFEPFTHALGQDEIFRLHASGDQISYVICAATLAYFVDKVVGTTRHYERMLSSVQERQVREDSVVAIGAFAAGRAHELATPLSTMDVLVRDLRARSDDAQRRCENLDLLAQQLHLSQEIVRNMTGAAMRQRQGAQGAIKFEAFLDEVIHRARQLHPMVLFTAGNSGLADAPPMLPDPALRQALHVLLDNAAQAARSEVHVHASLSGAELCITVRDDGQGFPAAVLEQLGHKPITTRQAQGGNGLGLMLARVTLDRLGGRLRLSNQAVGGALAQLSVPLKRIAACGAPR